jgi:hypothetical protein
MAKYEYNILENRNVSGIYVSINEQARMGWRCVSLVYASGMYTALMELEVEGK